MSVVTVHTNIEVNYMIAVEELGLHVKTEEKLKNNGFLYAEDVADHLVKHGIMDFIRKTKMQKIAVYKQIKPKLVLFGVWNVPTVEEKEAEIGMKIISTDDAAKMLMVGPKTVIELVEDGTIARDHYFICGEEVTAYQKTQKYVFIEEKVLDLAKKYNSSLRAIAKKLNVDESSISLVLKRDLTDEEMKVARLSAYQWNEAWIVENYKEIEMRANQRLRSSVTTYDEMISELIELIEEYFDFRMKNKEIIFDGVVYINVSYSKDARVDEYRRILYRSFYKVKCARVGIDGFFERNGKQKRLRSLSKEEQEKVQEYQLDIRTLKAEDISAIVSNIEGNGKTNYFLPLKGLLYYVLMKEEQKYLENLEISLNDDSVVFDANKEWAKIKAMKGRFDYSLNHGDMPKQRGKTTPENRKDKIFATRKQIVRCNYIISCNAIPKKKSTSKGLRSPIKYATQMLIGFLAGVRPVEMHQMLIEKHLDIEKNPENPNYGYLKKYKFVSVGTESIFKETNRDDLEGWGRLFISEEISKGGYSPSPSYGTLLVPRLVDQINDYLKWLYAKNPESKGRGYLFRVNDRNPDLAYSRPAQLFDWLPRARFAFDFLKEEQIKDFTYYETRHTVNNLIVNRTMVEDPQVNERKQRAAEMHCRHSMEDSGSKINIGHYQEELPLYFYHSVINTALNFPFDAEELLAWEKKNNPVGVAMEAAYKGEEEILDGLETISLNAESTSFTEEQKVRIAEIEKALEELNNEISILRTPHKAQKLRNLTGRERTKALAEINQQIKLYEQNKHKIIRGDAS